MEFLMDPSIWAGLLTLVVLEIVLGIDNLVFIAILADKLPPKQRDKARLLGLSLALIMRLGLLSLISWMVTLTKPLFTVMDFSFSGRDLIMLFGGIFLLFKATTELHERLENRDHDSGHGKGYASFWVVVTQIVILDAVFSLDAVITAVGMVNHLPVMMAAVVIAMAVMLLASKPLTRFVNQHPTVVVLCLSFLLMIGLSLVAEGFGFHIPKGYLYAAIGFSIIIEVFNQIARRNFIRHQSTLPLRARTADAILRLMGGKRQANVQHDADNPMPMPIPEGAFAEEERYMINGVLTLASRSLRGIMTPRGEISWVDAFVIGCAQAVAVLPGLSRSGSTIATGILLGDKREEVARFSFFMVIIPILGEGLLDLKKMLSPAGGSVSASTAGGDISLLSIIIGFVASFVVGCIACKWMIEIVKKGKLIWFALYCACVGVLCLIW